MSVVNCGCKQVSFFKLKFIYFKRDGLSAQLMCLVEQQRKYTSAVKQLTKECQKNEALLIHLKSIQ